MLKEILVSPESMQIFPFVSVIVPTYNRPNYLEGALRSLLVQDYPHDRFEMIVVDNGSKDGTIERIHSFAQEIKGKENVKFLRELRPGLVYARHSGAAHAEGEILIFTDDDALLDRNWISAIVKVYRLYPEVGAVGTKMAILWDREPESWLREYDHLFGKLDYGDKIVITKEGFDIYGGSFSIWKRVLEEVGGFNPGQKGRYIVGDSELGLCRKITALGIPIGWTPETTMWHLQRVERQGTRENVKVRSRNCGIFYAYSATFYQWSFRRRFDDLRSRTRSILRQLKRIVRTRDRTQLRYSFAFSMAEYWYYLKYLWLYRFSRSIRNEIRKEDWQFTSSYQAPRLELVQKIEN